MGKHEDNKGYVLKWMEKYAHGYKNACKKYSILSCLKPANAHINDRYLRRLMSELKHERHIASTCDKGYWFIPLQTTDPQEIEACMQSAEEMKSRAMDMLRDCDKHIKFWQDKKLTITQGQKEMVL